MNGVPFAAVDEGKPDTGLIGRRGCEGEVEGSGLWEKVEGGKPGGRGCGGDSGEGEGKDG